MKIESNLGIPSAVPVIVWGMDADGWIFRERVNAQRLSEQGALLEGIPQRLRTGDLVGVAYRDQKAHARITWMQDANSESRRPFSVQLLETARCPWMQALEPAAEQEPTERRRFRRYKVALPIELRPKDSDVPLLTNTSDASAGGCYIETMLPLPKGTELEIALRLDNTIIESTAVVRTCDLAVGMGIEFLNLRTTDREAVEQYLASQVG